MISFKNLFFFISLLPLHLLGASVDPSSLYGKSAPPPWIKFYELPLGDVPTKPSQVNLQYLLIDTQRHWEEKTLYRHFAIKALTQSGVEKISQLRIEFEPSYTEVAVHAIRIFREGKWLDRLEKSRAQILQREEDLENNLYRGDVTLVYFLEDIRPGDIVDYSYSLKGVHPLFSSHYTDKIYLQRDFSVERIIHRFLGDRDLSFLIKPVNTSIEPKISDLSPALREWTWEACDTLPYPYEDDQPAWYNPPAHVEMSQYQTWEEVVQKLSPLYLLPSDWGRSIPSGMQDLVDAWKTSTQEASERALFALRFVQDEVRYLGIEEGMGAFQPTDPRLTFERRFGDCKDKAFLLHALLRLMGIPSQPHLVHTSRGKRLPEVLPTPFAFDHLVLRIDLGGQSYYVDPTWSLQGGTLETTFFPSYHWGLSLSQYAQDLIPLPCVTFKNPVEIDTTITLESEDTAHLKIKSIFYDSRADRLRQSREWDGITNMEKWGLSRMQEVYGGATLAQPLEIIDDRSKNVLFFIESYRVPTQTLPDRKEIEIFSYAMRHYLDRYVNPERSSPYELAYPLWVKERIHIENPFLDRIPSESSYVQEHESLFCSLLTKRERNTTDFHFELKHLQDHIPQTALRDYWSAIQEIGRNTPLKVAVVLGSSSTVQTVTPRLCYLSIGMLAWPFFYLIYRKKRSSQNLLKFELNHFQRLCTLITGLSLVAVLNMSENLFWIGFGAAIPVSAISYFATARKSLDFYFLLPLLSCIPGGLLLYTEKS